MKTEKAMNASEVRENWREVIDTVSSNTSRIRIERSGTPVAGLVSARDLEWLALRDQRLAELQAVVARMRDAFADISEDEIEREVAKALTDVRAERQPNREATS